MTADLIVQPAALERLHRLGGPALLRQMIELYLQQGVERARSLQLALDTGDAAGLERAAHALKSSAGNLGAERLRAAAGTLEAVCGVGRLDETLVRRVLDEYAASETALRSVLQGLEP